MLLLFVFFSSAYALWSDGVAGVDHRNGDLTSFSVPSNNTRVCYDACVANTQCAAWVFAPAGSSCIGVNASCWLKEPGLAPAESNPCRVTGYTNRTLTPLAWTPAPLSTVVPQGWLADELRVQAGGLMGRLADFWGDIENSTWIGGPDDGGLHERAPYWLNGLVPASHLTGDARLASQRDEYLGAIVARQAASGWLGPEETGEDVYWGRFNVILSLLQQYDAAPAPALMTAVFKYLPEVRRRMLATPMGGWSVVRAQDFIWALWWLVDRFDGLVGVPAGFSQAWLIELADLTRAQMLANGGDWKT